MSERRLSDIFADTIIDFINPGVTKLVRHAFSNKKVAASLPRFFEIHQRIDTPQKYKNCEHILSFLGIEGTKSMFLGCYEVFGYETFQKKLLPEDFPLDGSDVTDTKIVFWKMKKVDIHNDLICRLIIEWGKGTVAFCQNATNEKVNYFPDDTHLENSINQVF